MDVRPETWNKRGLLDGTVAGIPHQGFGRAMKVGREEIAGLITALRIFAVGSDGADFHSLVWFARPDRARLRDISGIACDRTGPPRSKKPLPLLRITLTGAEPDAAYAVINHLLSGDPAIALGESYAEHNILIVNPHGLTESEAAIVGQQLREQLRVKG